MGSLPKSTIISEYVSNTTWLLHFSTVADDSDQVEEHSSVKQLKLTSEQGIAVTLEECFKVEFRGFNARLSLTYFFGAAKAESIFLWIFMRCFLLSLPAVVH